MKKILTVFLILLMLLSLASCGNETGSVKGDYDYTGTGSYSLIVKEDNVSLVIVCPYPNDSFTQNHFEIDLENLESYRGFTPETNAPGPILNNILGTIGFERKFLSVSPLDVSPKDAKKIAGKKIKIGIEMTDSTGSTYYAVLKYDKSIHD